MFSYGLWVLNDIGGEIIQHGAGVPGEYLLGSFLNELEPFSSVVSIQFQIEVRSELPCPLRSPFCQLGCFL